jgi:hypothetical protein
MAAFVTVLIVSNIASTKIVNFGPFTFDGGTLLFPVSYIFGDILTEVYGYGRARRVIWTGFFAAGTMALVLSVVGALPAAGDWPHQRAYEVILGQTPRIVAGSLLAFWLGEFSNSFILSKMKIRTGGRLLFLRTIGSTIIGEGVDTVVFVLVAFAGVLPTSLLWAIFISNYIFKVGVEVLATPATYLAVNRLKKEEGIDTFDTGINYSPFRLR